MVKVHCDPAQVIVNHASFRVQLPSAQKAQSPRISRPADGAPADTARIPVVGTVARRRAPLVWSGRSAPGDSGATGLLQAVRTSGVRHGDDPPGATQVIPRLDPDEAPTGEIPALTGHTPGEPLLPRMRSAGSTYDEDTYTPRHGTPAYDGDGPDDDREGHDGGDGSDLDQDGRPKARSAVRHAYYPYRRMNLGVVLLPLRLLLGFATTYAGMSKLCDPLYFDGGERGSLVHWLGSLKPWGIAEPLHGFALHHPVGAGLLVAFLQVLVGVLTVLGLWQRLAASVGALLAAALLVTVSWRATPVYGMSDVIFLAAWSPLIIAGAPVWSVDGKLAADAWRKLGPRAGLWELRRWVFKRGMVVATVAVGLTLLVGALLGGAVRDADRVVVPGPGETPRNSVPGMPLPSESGQVSGNPGASTTPGQAPSGGTTEGPSETTSGAEGAEQRETAGTGTTAPAETQGPGQAPPQQNAPQPPPQTSAGPGDDSSGGSGEPGGGPAPGDGGAEEPGEAPAEGGSGGGGSPKLVGGLFG
ncbi:DoxX family membrane protein [Streptomyces sp. NPDC058373]|uniref:DoxX family membrane protein n=1 Tax=Streptomyces sp. NPDC058373 TaxID=3346465 RepID=UPI0036693471